MRESSVVSYPLESVLIEVLSNSGITIKIEVSALLFVSPEFYIETELEGKSADEILIEINRLKRAIGRLRHELERAQTDEPTVVAGQDAALMMQREYLQAAKDVYAKTGAIYHLSRTEQAAAKFEADLLALKRLDYSIGGFFGGFQEIQIDVNHGAIINVAVTRPFGLVAPPVPQSNLPDDFLGALQKLHLEDWRHRYDSDVLDGTQWELKLTYANGSRGRSYYGSNNYPYNFQALQKLMTTIAGPDFDA